MKDAPKSGKCECGCENLTVAVDMTHYTPVMLGPDGKWAEAGHEHVEFYDAPEVIRLFCPDCGEYYNVPEELQ